MVKDTYVVSPVESLSLDAGMVECLSCHSLGDWSDFYVEVGKDVSE